MTEEVKDNNYSKSVQDVIKNTFEGIVKLLDHSTKEITDKLYGSEYTGTNGKLGGLHLEYMQLLENRLTYTMEIKEWYDQIKNNPEIILEPLYETKKVNYEKQLDSFDEKIRLINKSIKEIGLIRDYIDDLKQAIIRVGEIHTTTYEPYISLKPDFNSFEILQEDKDPNEDPLEKRVNNYLKNPWEL